MLEPTATGAAWRRNDSAAESEATNQREFTAIIIDDAVRLDPRPALSGEDKEDETPRLGGDGQGFAELIKYPAH